MSNQVAKRSQMNVYEAFAHQDTMAELTRVASAGIDVERFAQITLSTIQSKWDELSKCEPISVLTSALEAAQLGLDTNPSSGEYYFVRFGRTCTGILGYRGMIRLAYKIGAVDVIDAKVKYKGDILRYHEDEDGPHWEYRPYWQLGNDRGPIDYAYAHATLRNGKKIFKVADQIRLKKARDASQAKSTWRAHEEAMTAKTAIRELWKWLPKDEIDPGVVTAVNDDSAREFNGEATSRLSADWARGTFDLPPSSVAELEPAPGMEPNAG